MFNFVGNLKNLSLKDFLPMILSLINPFLGFAAQALLKDSNSPAKSEVKPNNAVNASMQTPAGDAFEWYST